MFQQNVQQQQEQQQASIFNQSAGSIYNFESFCSNVNLQQEESKVDEVPTQRRDLNNYLVEKLYRETFIQRPGSRNVIPSGGRKNKNETLSLTIARLIKAKYLHGHNFSRDIELVRGIQMNSKSDEFILVLRTDGRVVTMSDDVEHHLGKSMRSLCTQLINIFECLDRTDGDKLRSILNSSMSGTQQEYQLVCTLRLPKGKRPSRTQEDVKTITMAGHFFSCDNSPLCERLFIARCTALFSSTTRSSSSETSTTNRNDNQKSIVHFVLNNDMSIDTVSSNVKDIFGYQKTEMIRTWFGRYLPTDDLQRLETILQKYLKCDERQESVPMSINEIFDMYTNGGDERLTFLCQLRVKRQRRLKSIKFVVVAQLIDPSLRDEYAKYVQFNFKTLSQLSNAEQVNLASSSSKSKTNQDLIMADSPSLSMGLFAFNNTNVRESTQQQQQQYSPPIGSLSNDVAPIDINDEPWRTLFDLDYDKYPSVSDINFISTDCFEFASDVCQTPGQIANIFDEYLDSYTISNFID